MANVNKEIKTIEKYNGYSVVDAFKCFFYYIVLSGVLSIVLQIVVGFVANAKGLLYSDVMASETVGIISYVLAPVSTILFVLIYNAKRKLKLKEVLSDGQKINLLPISIAIVLAIICIFLFTPFMNLLNMIFSKWGYNADNSIPLQDKIASGGINILYGLIIFALLPAVAEELLFRGVIQTALSTRFKSHVSILLTALLFVLVHGSLQQTVYQFIVGLMLGYIALVGGSILYSIILHFLNNALVVVFSSFDIVSYLSGSNTSYYNIFSFIFPFLLFILGVALVVILFWVLKFLRNRNFFRLDEHGRFVTIDKNSFAKINEQKVGFKGMFSSLSGVEKIFFVSGLILVGIIWLINTIAGFM